jgi:hypothetical protein
MSTSGQDGYSSNEQDADSSEAVLERLKKHIAALESELANYASRYGLSDRARDLLAKPVVE